MLSSELMSGPRSVSQTKITVTNMEMVVICVDMKYSTPMWMENSITSVLPFLQQIVDVSCTV